MQFKMGVSAVVVGVALLTQGCGAGGMVKADAPPAPTGTEATVVFMRSTLMGAAISAAVYDVTAGEPRFVGIVQNSTKVAYNVAPGEHTFMVVSEAADFMKATVDPGKTYYALVTPRMGAWKARFSFKPLRLAELSGKDFAGWDSDTHYVQKGAEAEAWAKSNAADIAKKRDAYWAEWQSKPQDQRDSQTLNPGDGR